MDDASPLSFVAAAAAIGLLLLGAMLLLRLGRGGAPIAATTLDAPGAFLLELPPVSRPVEIAIRYTVWFPYHKPPGQPVRCRFGLVVELESGAERLVFGKGGDQPQGARDFEGLTESMKIWAPGSDGTPSRYTATQVVRRTEAPRAVIGSVWVTPGTMLERATISVR